jgi:hypothetical protein
MPIDQPLLETIPPPHVVRDKLGNALREVELLRKLLRISERAEQYRQVDQRRSAAGGPTHAA